MSTDLSGYAEGGFVGGPGAQVTVERVGQCPNGHPWFRIGASPHVEHIVGLDDLAPVSCAYRVHYLPQEGKK